MNHKFPSGIAVGALALVASAFACATTHADLDVGGDPDAGTTTGFVPTEPADATVETPVEAGPGVLNDGAPPVDATSCLPDAGGPGPISRVCLPATLNECDGRHDLPTYPANGNNGNGFDDDCDGLVDEGCSCDAAGITKTCYLVPASQTFGGVPVGWCAQNAKGTVDCVKPNSEFGGTWSGQCRGAQAPFADDVCANGDFDCDGKDQNSKASDCSCKGDPVQCPTDPLTTAPFPPKEALPLKVDASSWFLYGADVNSAVNWKWTVRGGDCDNIVPHPTFAVYSTASGTGSTSGSQYDTLGPSGKEHGIVATSPSVSSAIYPAFSLSGDYLVQGEFDLNGKHYSCQQKVQVRAPGIRAEACWDTEGQDVDVDLHVAQVTYGSSCAKRGWGTTCTNQDCYYANCKSSSPNWFAANPDTAACQGWGSQRSGTCSNPRLDRDLIDCDTAETNPNASDFCGPENINIDAPPAGTKYAVGLKYFGGDLVTRPHVNIYCNGERVLSTGFNPVTGNDFPKLAQDGSTTGDMWKVAMITATSAPGGGLGCDVHPVPSIQPYAATDGSNAYCVDNSTRDTAESTTMFVSGGATPLDEGALCFH